MNVSVFAPHRVIFFCGVVTISALAHAQTGTVLVRHSPTLNGTLDGSIQQMAAEPATLNGGAVVTGSLLVPGNPTVKLNGSPAFGGTIVGSGATSPTNYVVTLSGNSKLGHLVTRSDAWPIPTVAAPPAPTGTRTVSVSNSSQGTIDFIGLRNLTLNGNAGQVSIPAGTYGDFTANGSSGFSLGMSGATQPAAYNFQHLTLNGKTSVQVAGPVIVTIANGVALNGSMGSSAHPAWLMLRLAAGDLTLNGNVNLYAYALVPNGTITANGNSQIIGGTISDRLTLNGNALLRAIDLAPTVSLTTPADNTVITAPIAALTLSAAASDLDGAVAKVEFFNGSTKLGESATAPYQFTWTNIPAGTYSLAAKATDNAGVATTSAGVTFIANVPPSVALTAPADNAVFAAPATVTLAATASDADGTVAKVTFYDGTLKVGEVNAAPYQLSLASVSLGTHVFSAVATDNYGATGTSATRAVTIDTPPTAALAGPTSIARGVGATLTATAADADGSIAKVEFYRDRVLVGTVATPSGNPPVYSFTDPTALAPGTYSYVARSYDNVGLHTDSVAAIVSVLATLPYTADFEAAEGYATGTLNAQLGWAAAPPSGVSVVGDAAYNGAHSVALAPGTPPVRVAQTFAQLAGHDVVFADFFARPVAEADVTASTTFDVEGARFAFVLNGATATLNAFNGDAAGGGNWQPTSYTASVGADHQVQTWIRLTARLDFAHKTWDLYAGGKMVAADLNFRDSSASYLSSFAVRGDAATVSRLDYIFVGADNPLFADTNNNGIDDAWETAHGLLLTTDNRTGDPDGDGKTNLAEYIAGTDPQDFYNGQAPVITSLVAANGTPGTNGLIQVKVSDAGGSALANAPVVFAVGQGATRLSDSVGGTATMTVSVRTDSTGTASAYVVFNTDTTATVNVTAGTAALALSLNSGVSDSDGNGLPDAWERKYFGHIGLDPNSDPTHKGMTLAQDSQHGTDPTKIDTVGDGIADAWKIQYGLDPLVNQAAGDLVGDGVPNLTKYLEGRNPTVQALPDSTNVVHLIVTRPN